MSMRVWRVGVLVLGCGLVSSAVAGESFEEVSKKIVAASKKLKSFSAKTKTVTQLKRASFSMLSTVEGTTEMLRRGDDLLVRLESKSVTETTFGDSTTKRESSTLRISDGSYTYTLSETAGKKTARKTKMEKSDADPFKAWRGNSKLEVLPDSSLDGHAVWVIEAIPKQNRSLRGKTVIYYHKQSGQMIKIVAYTPDGEPMTTTTYSDFKINEKISPDRFVFKAPPGVKVQDTSK